MIYDKSKLGYGKYCHYNPSHGKKENGRIKSVDGEFAFVVFHCAGNWDKFAEYTGQRVAIKDLCSGWVDDNARILPEHCDHYYIPTNSKWASICQVQCQYCGNILN